MKIGISTDEWGNNQVWRGEMYLRWEFLFVCFLLSKILTESNTMVGTSALPCSLPASLNRTGALHLCHFILHKHHWYCVCRTEKHYFTNQTTRLSNYPDFCLFKHSNVSNSPLIYFVSRVHTHTDMPVNCAPQIWTGAISVLFINLAWDHSPELRPMEVEEPTSGLLTSAKHGDHTQSAHWEWPLAHTDSPTMPIDWERAAQPEARGCPEADLHTEGWAPSSHTCSASV